MSVGGAAMIAGAEPVGNGLGGAAAIGGMMVGAVAVGGVVVGKVTVGEATLTGGTIRTAARPVSEIVPPPGAFGRRIVAVDGCAGPRISNCAPPPLIAPLGTALVGGVLVGAVFVDGDGVELRPLPLAVPVIRNCIGTAPPGGGTVGINTAGGEADAWPADDGVLIAYGDVGGATAVGVAVAEAAAVGVGALPNVRGDASGRSLGRASLLRKPFGCAEFAGD